MARYSIYLGEDLEELLNIYMKENKIKKRSVAIKDCIKKVMFNYEKEESNFEISEKLNRILYRQNLNKKLLEQIFANMGFPINEDPDKDELLKNFYEKHNNIYKFKANR